MNQTRTLPLLFLSFAAVTFAQQKPVKPDLRFDDPRVVRANERTVIPIYLCELQGIEVTLPKGELLRLSTVGDSENWVVTAVPEDRRDVSIRPREPMTQETILNLTSDHESRYVFRLVLNAGHCDSHVTLEADRELEQKIQTAQPWVSPEKYQEALKSAEDAKKQVEDANRHAQQAAQAAEQSKNTFRQTYPEHLAFDYRYDKKKAAAFGVSEIFHDDRFTYIQVQSEEPPVLFERKDGQPSLIEFSYADGLYRTARVIDEGYLVRGGNGNGKHQEKLELKRDPKPAAPLSSSAEDHGGR